MKRHVAICGGREAVADFILGGGGGPPVKIGLIKIVSHVPGSNGTELREGVTLVLYQFMMVNCNTRFQLI